MALLKFLDFINESKDQSSVTDKDWDRMVKLVQKGDEGKGVAATIKDKGKAIARFVAGEKLSGKSKLDFEKSSYGRNGGSYGYQHNYREFGDKAISLGATPEEIEKIFDETVVPQKYLDEMTKNKDKHLGSWVTGAVSRLILDLGHDITYLTKGGNALTSDGREAMSRNGRKWTIGYKTEITMGSKKVEFDFDAITDEGVDNNTVYFVVANSSDKIFKSLFYREYPLGIRALTTELKAILK